MCVKNGVGDVCVCQNGVGDVSVENGVGNVCVDSKMGGGCVSVESVVGDVCLVRIVTVWNRMRPRAPVQNQQTRELICSQKGEN